MRRLAILTVVLLGGCGPAGAGAAVTPTAPPQSVPAPTHSAAQATPGHLSAVQAVNAEAAAYPDEFCGRYQNSGFTPDIPNGVFVSMWLANLEIHAAHIRALADGTQPLAFVACTYARAQLERLEDALSNPESLAWLATIPAAALSGGVDEINNRVELDISSAVPDAAEQVTSHFAAVFGVAPGILHVWSDGNGAALRPWGAIRLTVLGPDRRPVHVANDLSVEWAGDLPNLRCGVGDVGYGVSPNGAPTDLPCQAGRWRISINTGLDTLTVGSGEVSVTGGHTADLTIKVSVVPSPHP